MLYGCGFQSIITSNDICYILFAYKKVVCLLYTYTYTYIACKLVYRALCIQLYFFRTERDLPDFLITDRLNINRNMAQAPVPKKKKKRNKGLFNEILESLCGFF